MFDPFRSASLSARSASTIRDLRSGNSAFRLTVTLDVEPLDVEELALERAAARGDGQTSADNELRAAATAVDVPRATSDAVRDAIDLGVTAALEQVRGAWRETSARRRRRRRLTCVERCQGAIAGFPVTHCRVVVTTADVAIGDAAGSSLLTSNAASIFRAFLPCARRVATIRARSHWPSTRRRRRSDVGERCAEQLRCGDGARRRAARRAAFARSASTPNERLARR